MSVPLNEQHPSLFRHGVSLRRCPQHLVGYAHLYQITVAPAWPQGSSSAAASHRRETKKHQKVPSCGSETARCYPRPCCRTGGSIGPLRAHGGAPRRARPAPPEGSPHRAPAPPPLPQHRGAPLAVLVAARPARPGRRRWRQRHGGSVNAAAGCGELGEAGAAFLPPPSFFLPAGRGGWCWVRPFLSPRPLLLRPGAAAGRCVCESVRVLPPALRPPGARVSLWARCFPLKALVAAGCCMGSAGMQII